MKKFIYQLAAFASLALLFTACTEDEALTPAGTVPADVLEKIGQLGFSTEGVEIIDEGFRVEHDIILTADNLALAGHDHRVPQLEQYSTNNLVSAGNGRNISIYVPTGRKGFSSTYEAAVDEVVSRFNAENLTLTFSRTSNSRTADISLSRLGKRDERRGVLGSAGFPTGAGDPYGQILMSGILESTYGLGVNGIATIIAHEVGHCIGFRHTDYFDRSISCGGSLANEGPSTVGANHIPGTPTGANPNTDLSWMLACTDGGNRPFTNNDKTALDFLY